MNCGQMMATCKIKNILNGEIKYELKQCKIQLKTYTLESCGVQVANLPLYQYVQLDSFLLICASRSGNEIAKNLFEAIEEERKKSKETFF